MSVDLGIELGLTVFVTSRRYRQTNSAQALKETDRVHATERGSMLIRKGVTTRLLCKFIRVRVRFRVRVT